MSIAPVPRPVASATYGFVRFIGGGLAPFVAGKLVEHYNAHVPFVLDEAQPGPSHERLDAEEAVFEVPGLEEESVIADEALRDDRALNNPRQQ
jgi:ACDE family multidrug resistance protein